MKTSRQKTVIVIATVVLLPGPAVAQDQPAPALVAKFSVSGTAPEDIRQFALDSAKTHGVRRKSVEQLFRWVPNDDSLETLKRRIFPREWGAILVMPGSAKRLGWVSYMQILEGEVPRHFLPANKAGKDRTTESTQQDDNVFESTRTTNTQVPVLDGGSVSLRSVPLMSVREFYCVRNGALWHADNNVFADVGLPTLKFPTDGRFRVSLDMDLTHIQRNVRNAWNSAFALGFETQLQTADDETPEGQSRRLAQRTRNSLPAWLIKNLEKASLAVEGKSRLEGAVTFKLRGISGAEWASTAIRSRHQRVDGLSTVAVSLGFPNWKSIGGMKRKFVKTPLDALTFIANRDRKLDACLHLGGEAPAAFAVLALSSSAAREDAEMIANTLTLAQLPNCECKASDRQIFVLLNTGVEHPAAADLLRAYGTRRPERAPVLDVDIRGEHVIALSGALGQLLGKRQRLLPTQAKLDAIVRGLRRREYVRDRLRFRVLTRRDSLTGNGSVSRGFVQSAILFAGALYEEKQRRFQDSSEDVLFGPKMAPKRK